MNYGHSACFEVKLEVLLFVSSYLFDASCGISKISYNAVSPHDLQTSCLYLL